MTDSSLLRTSPYWLKRLGFAGKPKVVKHPIDVGGLSVAPGGKGALGVDAGKESTGLGDLGKIIVTSRTGAAHESSVFSRSTHAYAPSREKWEGPCLIVAGEPDGQKRVSGGREYCWPQRAKNHV